MHLAGECSDAGRALPAVVTATLMKGAVSLHLAEDADLPEPWRGAGREWSLPLSEPMPERGDVLPPYPLLVTVGQDNNGLRLVNLEHLGVVALAGDSERTEALARHIAAELALNPWSTIVEVNVIGLGEELATLDTLRLRHHADGEQVVPSFVRDVTTSLEHGMGDPDPYRAVITAGDGTGDLAPLLATPSIPSRHSNRLAGSAPPRIDSLRVRSRRATACAHPRSRPPSCRTDERGSEGVRRDRRSDARERAGEGPALRAGR